MNRRKYINEEIERNDFTETLIIVTGIFFIWGFITSMNSILLPKLEVVLQLDTFSTILVQSSFFAAYFIVSLIYFVISTNLKDPILTFGFRRIIIIGITIAGIGCALFYPAAEFREYSFFITALFILAAGIAILQIGANPYVVLLGKERNSASRLILSQAFNSLGTTLAPFTSLLIFTNTQSYESADTVKLPYLALAASLVFFAILLRTTSFSNIFNQENFDKTAPQGSILKEKHLLLGVIAIFMYVGGEVSIGSYIVQFIKAENLGSIGIEDSGTYLSMYWGGAMIGRFSGALLLSKMNKQQRYRINAFLIIVVITVSFLISENLIQSILLIFIFCLHFFGFYLGKYRPNKTLGVFAIIIILLLTLGAFAHGKIALWGIISIGLFNSIMFPVIFTLGIKNLGYKTYQGSSLLVMGIVGGALIPPLQEVISESVGIQKSYLLPIICYLYVAYYGFKGFETKE